MGGKRWNRGVLARRDNSAAARQADIDDETWFELQLKPEQALQRCGVALPDLPPDEVQRAYTGRAGRTNLEQAFGFYRHVCALTGIREIDRPGILDFGAGWGRISRFFLRDTEPDRIYAVDCTSDAVRWLHETKNPCNIIQNEPAPPIEGFDQPLDLAYAWSVFSHLTEEYARAWIDYLLDQLKPGGYLVLTSRGSIFIDYLDRIRRENADQTAVMEQLPAAGELRRRYERGEFQFYPAGGRAELTSDFYGEAFIPRNWIEKSYRSELVDFDESGLDQSVIILQRR